jgi:hypothetical protein
MTDSDGPLARPLRVPLCKQLTGSISPFFKISPYSPDMAPFDSHVFRKFKEAFRGQQHISNE